MEVSNLVIFDNVLSGPDSYVDHILSGEFQDYPDGDKVFKGIQLAPDNGISALLKEYFPNHDATYNFIRRSPEGQEEPNTVHSDREMCDTIALLYLNKEFPEGAGTTIYEDNNSGSTIDRGDASENFTPSIHISMKYNRMIAFPSDLYHSRNIKNNFGSGDNARLVQVVFLKRK